MIKLSYGLRLLQNGLSIVTISDNKQANFSWKSCQEKALAPQELERRYNEKGREYLDKEGVKRQIRPTKGLAIVTGFGNLECIDVDLKVLPTLKKQNIFWNELLSFLKESINNFDDKFVIYQTINAGYHIIYKSKKIEPSQPLAKDDQKRCLIETRGVGGYIAMYEKKVSKRGYEDIQEISELERDALINCCKYFDYIESPVRAETTENISTITDYNAKVNIWDLIEDEFEIIRRLSDRTVIRRHGAESAHSGSIFNNNRLYLFSTSTQYPERRALDSFDVFTIKHHNGDKKASARDLYGRGYGSRRVKKPENIEPLIKVKNIEFPIEVFPIEIQNFLKESANKLDMSVDYMGASFLWVLSVIIGNAVKIQVKNGWIEPVTVWIALVGKPGVGKSPSISQITKPLERLNNNEIKNFIKKSKKFLEYEKLTKSEKEVNEYVAEPKISQFIVNDITQEGYMNVHDQNPKGVGILVDELAGLLKGFNKYNVNSNEKEFHLTAWSNKDVSATRKTAKSLFLPSPINPILGGMQPNILVEHFTEENKSNGFVDRILIAYPEKEVEYFNTNEISHEWLTWYSDEILNFNEMINTRIRYDDEGLIEPIIAQFNPDAKDMFIKVFDEYTSIQRSEEESEYYKSMYPKQKSYIPRFALLLNTYNSYLTGEPIEEITLQSVEGAAKLSKYFVNQAKKIKEFTTEIKDIKNSIDFRKNKKDQVHSAIEANPNINKKELCELLDISRTQLYRYLKND